jgi:hypothetical protein
MTTTAAGEGAPECTDPAVLREQAGQALWEAMLCRSRADEAYRRADELEHLAALAEKADAADDALAALLPASEPLEAAEAAAVTALREAEDLVRAARGRLTKARNAEARADGTGDLPASEDAAARTAKAERNLAGAEKALADRQRELAAAEKALAAHNREIAGATARAREATAAVMNPGPAPRRHGSLIAIGSVDDMSLEQRQALALAMGIAARASGSGTPAPAPSQMSGSPNWRDELTRMDPARSRAVVHAGGTHIFPPSRPGRP